MPIVSAKKETDKLMENFQNVTVSQLEFLKVLYVHRQAQSY
jgi:hypothetical protein